MKDEIRHEALTKLEEYFLGGRMFLKSVDGVEDIVRNLIYVHFQQMTTTINLIELAVVRAKNSG